jgi:AAA15 family ATPase/GTPase
LVTAQTLASEGIEASDKKRLVEFLKDADFEIDDIAVSRQDVPEVEKFLTAEIPDEAKRQLRDRLGGLKVELGHHTSSGKSVRLPLEAESDGTQRLFELAAPWLLSLSEGYVVLVDELDRSLHPLLTRKLVEAFHNPKVNAQLVFTTHDTTLLDPGLFRRDQVWLTERTPSGSVLYSLSDYKAVRKTESLQKGYLAGRYGAIPILRSFGLHEED